MAARFRLPILWFLPLRIVLTAGVVYLLPALPSAAGDMPQKPQIDWWDTKYEASKHECRDASANAAIDILNQWIA